MRTLVNRFTDAGEHDAARVLHAVAEGHAGRLVGVARRALRANGRDHWRERHEAIDALLDGDPERDPELEPVHIQAMIDRDAPSRSIAATLLLGIAELAPGLGIVGAYGVTDRGGRRAVNPAMLERADRALQKIERKAELYLRTVLAAIGVPKAKREALLSYRKRRA